MHDKISIGLAFLALLFILVPATACFQEEETSYAAPPGLVPPGAMRMPWSPTDQKVDVGGLELGYRCLGEGGPTVVIETGHGDSGSSWRRLLPRIAELTRVCLYSRAGLGTSDPPRPGPRTVEHVVEELHALLTNIGIEGPYVLVGHSLGGIHARAYAARFPDEIVGMVLVDTTSTISEKEAALMEALKPPLFKEFHAAWQQSQQSAERISDRRAYIVAVGELPRLGEIPLVVMGSGKKFDLSGWRARMPENAREVYERNQEEIDSYIDSQRVAGSKRNRDQALLSTNGRYVEIEDAGHFIHRDQPDQVLEAIREVVEAARR